MKTLIIILSRLFTITAITIIPVGINAVINFSYTALFWFTFNTLVLVLSYGCMLLAFMFRFHDIWIFKGMKY